MPFDFNVLRFNKMAPLCSVGFVEVLKDKLFTCYCTNNTKNPTWIDPLITVDEMIVDRINCGQCMQHP